MIIDILCFIAGALMSFFLYACILVGKHADEKMEDKDNENEWRKSS